jgi:diguanylate cyclase (GGDEF)-like protein
MSWVVTRRRAPSHAPLAARTWMLALLDGTSAVGLAAVAAAPLSVAAPTGLYLACAGVLAVIAVGLLTFGAHVGTRGLLALAGVRLVVVTVTVAVATDGGATLFGGAGLIWVLLWVTGFFPRRTAIITFLVEILAAAIAVAIDPAHVRTAIDLFPMMTGAALLSMLLSEVLNSLRHEARHDELTGLMNRRGLDQALHDLSRGRRFAGQVSLVAIDLDGLKLVNDHGGHLAGDQMLLTFATELQTAARGVDLTARIGGDEFVAILPGLCGSEAAAWAERLRESSVVAWSFGVAERRASESLQPWLGRADKLMYAAKSAARSDSPKRLVALA